LALGLVEIELVLSCVDSKGLLNISLQLCEIRKGKGLRRTGRRNAPFKCVRKRVGTSRLRSPDYGAARKCTRRASYRSVRNHLSASQTYATDITRRNPPAVFTGQYPDETS